MANTIKTILLTLLIVYGVWASWQLYQTRSPIVPSASMGLNEEDKKWYFIGVNEKGEVKCE